MRLENTSLKDLPLTQANHKTSKPSAIEAQEGGMNKNVFFLLLLMYQLIFSFQGFDLSDEGFNAVFFQQIFDHPESVQYNFMFWFSGIIGGAYLKLFPFLGLWGLRLAGLLANMATAILTYNLLKRYLGKNYLMLGILLVTMSYNNDLKSFCYNNLSALLYVGLVYLLVKGLKEDKPIHIFLSGSFIALNTFTRLPNILGLGLILVIPYYYYLYKYRAPKRMLAQALFFIGGFLITTVAVLSFMHVTGHLEVFRNIIEQTFNKGSSNPTPTDQDNYAMSRLIMLYLSHFGQSIAITLIIVAFTLGLIFFTNYLKRNFNKEQKIARLARYAALLITSLLIIKLCILIFQGTVNYYHTLFFYAGIILISSLLILTAKVNKEIKVLTFCGCFILLSYPFGSFLGIATAGRYVLWIGLPIAIDYIFNIKQLSRHISIGFKGVKRSIYLSASHRDLNRAKKILLGICIFAGLYQSYRYPLFDARNRIKMTYSIDDKKLKGIYTTKGRADAINELLRESKKYVKPNDYVLAYDCIPLYNYLTGTIPFLHNSYPWLYKEDVLKTDLNNSLQERKLLPIVVSQKIQTNFEGSRWPDKLSPGDYLKSKANQGRNAVLNKFLQENHYKVAWENQFFKIQIPGNADLASILEKE